MLLSDPRSGTVVCEFLICKFELWFVSCCCRFVSVRYIESIQRDVKWMGGDWGEHLYYASDYFQQLYDWAEDLISKDLAFVDFDTPEEIKMKRGSITQPGEESPYKRKFTVEDNLKLFRE